MKQISQPGSLQCDEVIMIDKIFKMNQLIAKQNSVILAHKITTKNYTVNDLSWKFMAFITGDGIFHGRLTIKLFPHSLLYEFYMGYRPLFLTSHRILQTTMYWCNYKQSEIHI